MVYKMLHKKPDFPWFVPRYASTAIEAQNKKVKLHTEGLSTTHKQYCLFEIIMYSCIWSALKEIEWELSVQSKLILIQQYLITVGVILK